MPDASPERSPTAAETRTLKFGQLLRTLRTGAGLSQDGLAERAGISAKTVGALEQGARRAGHDDTIHRIATALQLPSADRDALFEAARQSRARQLERAEEPHGAQLPTPLTSFVERPEVEEIAALLDGDRLVTITGSGGVGKTRTAVEIARGAARRGCRFWFVDLSRVRDGDAILAELGSSLGIGATEADAAFASVVRYLNAHSCNLLLDNCEQLLDGLADLVTRLLQACPRLKILATSREPLSLSFEKSYRLPSLHVPSGRIANLEQALEYSALRLFLARTGSDRAAWLHTSRSLEKVGKLCRQLDGIPLAIELAASRVATLGLDMLLTDLAKGLTLSGKRDSPERHRTMTTTIAWSYDLLDATEQAVLRRLSVFAGSFSLDVAQRVCADAEIPAYGIVDACHRLAQKSLIVVEHGEGVRYRLLSAIRSFGEARLLPDELDAARRNHRRWVLELSEWKGTFPLATIRPNFDNVRACVDRCLELGDDESILNAAAIVSSLWLVWYETSRTAELKHYVEALLSRVDAEKDVRLASRLLTAVCACSTPRELPAATARAVGALVAAGDRPRAGSILGRLANTQFRSGNVEAANRSLHEAFEFLSGADVSSSAYYRECLMGRAWQSCAQADVARANADLREFARYLDASACPSRQDRHSFRVVAADVAFVEGDARKAVSLLEVELDDLNGLSPGRRFQVRHNLAVYHAVLGATEIASRLVRTVLEDVADSEWSPIFEAFYDILLPAAAVAAVYERIRLATIIMGHYTHHVLKGREIWATEAPLCEMIVAMLRDRLSPAEMDELLAEGAATLPENILTYVQADSVFAPI